MNGWMDGWMYVWMKKWNDNETKTRRNINWCGMNLSYLTLSVLWWKIWCVYGDVVTFQGRRCRSVVDFFFLFLFLNVKVYKWREISTAAALFQHSRILFHWCRKNRARITFQIRRPRSSPKLMNSTSWKTEREWDNKRILMLVVTGDNTIHYYAMTWMTQSSVIIENSFSESLQRLCHPFLGQRETRLAYRVDQSAVNSIQEQRDRWQRHQYQKMRDQERLICTKLSIKMKNPSLENNCQSITINT